MMISTTSKPITTRPLVVIAGLTVLAVLAFLFVNRLVNRFGEQEKALARHLYEQGLAEQKAGRPDRAIEDFRAALIYNRDNSEYQLSLARALRVTGRTDESETYLIGLWERSPQDGPVNLALGRLAAQQRLLDKSLQYYHNAIYGVWASDADTNRLNAWFELIEFLLRQAAYPQAQAELIALAAQLPQHSDLQLRVADLFARAQDYDHAFAQYQQVLRLDRENVAALAGAGEAAFNLGRYRTAQQYLQSALRVNPADTQTSQLLQTSNLILDADPFSPRLSNAERNRRIRSAFVQAGQRLDTCAQSKGIDLKAASAPTGLSPLKAHWNEMKTKLRPLVAQGENDIADAAMDLVFEIEQEASKECGPPSGLDQALLLLAQNRAGFDKNGLDRNGAER
jgi:tetratricopeptide (TPR) repeat protein